MKMLLREIDAERTAAKMVCQDLTEVLLSQKIVRMASVSLRLTAPPSESKGMCRRKALYR